MGEGTPRQFHNLVSSKAKGYFIEGCRNGNFYIEALEKYIPEALSKKVKEEYLDVWAEPFTN